MNIYKNANLEEQEINGKKVLTREIDYDYVDEDTELTNQERMGRGLSPVDSKTGETIELHHIGQKNESSFAELTQSEHRNQKKYGILHDINGESKINRDEFNRERAEYWKERSIKI